MYRTYIESEVRAAVASSPSYREVCRKLGRSPVGGNSCHIRRLCEQWDIDTSHMTGQGHMKGKTALNQRNPVDRLVMGDRMDGRAKAHHLRNGLLALGIEYKCSYCPTRDVWNGKPITLEVNHKDGQFWNNLPENLEFACPNCHSQYGKD
jgi:5-methylcytosine-specific restriction endonuclease McrA